MSRFIILKQLSCGSKPEQHRIFFSSKPPSALDSILPKDNLCSKFSMRRYRFLPIKLLNLWKIVDTAGKVFRKSCKPDPDIQHMKISFHQALEWCSDFCPLDFCLCLTRKTQPTANKKLFWILPYIMLLSLAGLTFEMHGFRSFRVTVFNCDGPPNKTLFLSTAPPWYWWRCHCRRRREYLRCSTCPGWTSSHRTSLHSSSFAATKSLSSPSTLNSSGKTWKWWWHKW